MRRVSNVVLLLIALFCCGRTRAENAAEYLCKGSRVNVVGRVQNNVYEGKDGSTVYGFTFTCEEIDYLDSKAETEARRTHA